MIIDSSSPKFISLFCGCGGFDTGFIDAGFRCNGAFDIDNKVLEVHNRNLNSPVYQHDLSVCNMPLDLTNNVDVLLAGSPCQGFSTIGKRKIDDPRNTLLYTVGHVACQYKPKIVIAENVPAVRYGKHKSYWEGLHDLLRGAGYRTADLLTCGTDLGLAQRRSRVFLIAWKGKELKPILPKISSPSLKEVLKEIDGVKNHEVECLPTSSIHYKIAIRIKPNQKLSNVRSGPRNIHSWDIPEVFGATSMYEKRILETVLRLRRQRRVRDYGDADPVPTELLYEQFGVKPIISLENKGFLRKIDKCHDLVGAFNGKYRRLSWEKPSYTVDTRFGDPKYFLHPSEHRGFSVREAARIQGFADTFMFHGSRSEQYRMVGNAVPPKMAFSIATFIRKSIFE